MSNKIELAFEEWKKRLKDNHITAICKPCWELNYCPYGALVEDFPISENDDYKCTIFGHECPVFFVAEPFTETKSPRTISRKIPRSVQFKVFRRDNQVCQVCGANVPFEKINFDHIIPWSKGGSSDERNIRLLCEKCNKSRGANFENEYLKITLREHFHDLMELELDMLSDLLRMVLLWKTLLDNGQEISEAVFCEIIKSDDDDTDKFMYDITLQLINILMADTPFITTKKKIQALKYRWSLCDGVCHNIEETIMKYGLRIESYIEAEALLLRLLGLKLKDTVVASMEYPKVKTELPMLYN